MLKSQDPNIYYVLIKFILIHAILVLGLLAGFYALVGIPIYYTYESDLQGVELYFFILFYSLIAFPIHIHYLRKVSTKHKSTPKAIKAQIILAWILMCPAFYVFGGSLLYGFIVSIFF